MGSEGYLQEITNLKRLGATKDTLWVYPRIVNKKIKEEELSEIGKRVPLMVVMEKNIPRIPNIPIGVPYMEDIKSLFSIFNSHLLVIPITSTLTGVAEIEDGLLFSKRYSSYMKGRHGTVFANSAVDSIYVNGVNILKGSKIVATKYTHADILNYHTIPTVLNNIFNDISLAIAS